MCSKLQSEIRILFFFFLFYFASDKPLICDDVLSTKKLWIWFVRLLDSPNLTFVKQSLFNQASKMKASDLPPKRPDFNSPCHMWYVQLWWASRGKLDTEILMWRWDEIRRTMGGNWTILRNEQTRLNHVWSSNEIEWDSSCSFLNLKYQTLFVQIHL